MVENKLREEIHDVTCTETGNEFTALLLELDEIKERNHLIIRHKSSGAEITASSPIPHRMATNTWPSNGIKAACNH